MKRLESIRKWLFAASSAAVLVVAAGCGGGSKPTGSHSSMPISTVKFDCSNSNTATVNFWADYAVFNGTLNGKTYTNVRLPKVAAASGAKYSDGTHSVWDKGNESTIEIGSGESYTCTAQSRQAARN